MSAITDLILRMSAAGASGEVIAMAVEALEQASPKRSAGAERMARYRERHKASHGNDSDEVVTESVTSPSPLVPPLDKEIPPTPPKEIKSPPIIPPTTGLGSASDWPANAEVIETIIAETGLRLTTAETWHLRTAGVVALWRHNGFSFWDEVLPTIKALVDGGAKVKSWAYFTDAIAQCRADRLKPIPIPEPRQPNERRNPDNRGQSAGRPTDYMREAIDIDQQRRGAQLDRASGF